MTDLGIHMIKIKTTLFILLAGAIAVPASADFYRSADADGNLSFSSYRRVSTSHADAQPQRWTPSETLFQRYSNASATDTGRDIVPFRSHRGLMTVDVRLNEDVIAPFIIDTGATGISLTPEIAAQLNLDRAPRRFIRAITANGPIELPVVELDSVEVGNSRVTDLVAMINPHLEVGLIGASFLSNFVYSVDVASSVVILERIEN